MPQVLREVVVQRAFPRVVALPLRDRLNCYCSSGFFNQFPINFQSIFSWQHCQQIITYSGWGGDLHADSGAAASCMWCRPHFAGKCRLVNNVINLVIVHELFELMMSMSMYKTNPRQAHRISNELLRSVPKGRVRKDMFVSACLMMERAGQRTTSAISTSGPTYASSLLNRFQLSKF